MQNLTSTRGGSCSPQSILAAIDKLLAVADQVEDAAQAIRAGRPTLPPMGASDLRALAVHPPGARLDDAVGEPVEPQRIRWYVSHASLTSDEDPDSGFRLVAHFDRLERVWWHVEPAWIAYRVYYRHCDHSIFIPRMTRLPDWHAAKRAGALVPSPIAPGPPRVFAHGKYAQSPGLSPAQYWHWGEPCEPPPGASHEPPAGYPWAPEPIAAGAA